MTPQVTILCPHYKTPELTRVCIRLLGKHTRPELAKVVVIDNDSADESLDYLRTLKWIKLIERQTHQSNGEKAPPPFQHSRALDLGLATVDTPFVLVDSKAILQDESLDR